MVVSTRARGTTTCWRWLATRNTRGGDGYHPAPFVGAPALVRRMGPRHPLDSPPVKKSVLSSAWFTDDRFPNFPPRLIKTPAAVETSVNQIGFSTPPSTGAAPSWDAIVEVGGSQQFVSEGRYYECHSLKGVEPGSKIAFERVLATLDGANPTFGMPYVVGARVEATVLENFKDKKLIVFKYRRKKHYKRKNGHRQPMTRFLVTKVVKP
jgi:large subunit ribosomal protein L21